MPMSYGGGAYGGSPSHDDPGEDDPEEGEEKGEAAERAACPVAHKLTVPEKCIVAIIVIAAIAIFCSICSALF